MSSGAVLPEVFGKPHLPASWEAAALLIDKPRGMSSFGVVKRVRHRLPVRKVGHAGTLDPMATGLLILLIGRGTKSMEAFMGQDKVYEGVIRLGQSTPSYDAETEVQTSAEVDHLSDRAISEAARSLTGDVLQEAPPFSAIKQGGERLYRKARRGDTIVLPLRPVRIDRFDVEERQGRDVAFSVACSKGTYVRSLAHDLGKVLGVGGHLVALRRRASGSLSVGDAWPLDELCDMLEARADRALASPGSGAS